MVFSNPLHFLVDWRDFCSAFSRLDFLTVTWSKGELPLVNSITQTLANVSVSLLIILVLFCVI